MAYALVIDGVVQDLLRPQEGFTLEECFHPSLISQLIPAEDEVLVGWVWNGSTFSPPETAT